jgi:hypothetical protein
MMKSTQSASKIGRQHPLILCLVAGLSLITARNASATEYYVATTGSDSNAGTLASPFATLQKGADFAGPGDTVYLRGGTYYSTSQITLSRSGTSDTNRTKIWAYPGEVPVLDFSSYANASSASDVPAILLTGNWMHLKGLEIANGKVGLAGSHSYSMVRTKNTSNNTFELLNIHHGFGPGLFIDDTLGAGGHLILNCDSHDNYDVNGSQGDGQNGNGFGVHYQTSGPTTTIRGCRAWWNSNDGYDLIYQEVPVTIENSGAFGNGFANYGATNPSSGNGNGFKMGSSGTGVRHIVQNNIAWKNKAVGFYANHSSGGSTWYNNTSYNNGTQYNMLASSFAADGKTIVTPVIVLTGTKVHIMRNNIGFPNNNLYMTGVDSQYNTWDLGVIQSSGDFLSITDPTMSGTGQTIETASPALGPRQADGSLPNVDFLKQGAGSQMIDRGTNVGIPYSGTAPDLGAYEYVAGGGGTGGATASGGTTGTGGATASGGTTGTGGATASGGVITTGGIAASGGVTGAGGATSTGGVSGTGGATPTGGIFGTGGVVSTGGRIFGSGAGGVVGAGGSVLTGGSVVTDASLASGGAIGAGGFAAGGGVAGTGGIDAGGSAASGGTQAPDAKSPSDSGVSTLDTAGPVRDAGSSIADAPVGAETFSPDTAEAEAGSATNGGEIDAGQSMPVARGSRHGLYDVPSCAFGHSAGDSWAAALAMLAVCILRVRARRGRETR